MGLLYVMNMSSQEVYDLSGLYFRQVKLGDLKKTTAIKGIKIVGTSGMLYQNYSYSQIKSIHKILYELLDCKGKKPSRKEFKKIISNKELGFVIDLYEWCLGID